MIGAYICNKIYHLTLTALSHYRVKCEQVQFCEHDNVALISDDFIYLFIYLFNPQLDTMQIKTYNSKTHNSQHTNCKTSRQSTNRCLHY